MAAYDVAVIGGGPGGYSAAIRARQLGLKIALIEDAELGGICLNWGCIPTKALLKQAEVYQLFLRAEEFGLRVAKPAVDWDAVIGRSRQVAAQLSKGVAYLMQKNQVEVFAGRGRLTPQPPSGGRGRHGRGRGRARRRARNAGHRQPPQIHSGRRIRRRADHRQPRGHGRGRAARLPRHHRGWGYRRRIRLFLSSLWQPRLALRSPAPGLAARRRRDRRGLGRQLGTAGNRSGDRS